MGVARPVGPTRTHRAFDAEARPSRALLPSHGSTLPLTMEPSTPVVFNRSDCPYGCGASLEPGLRWQATPCRRCGRPLYPLNEAMDDEGRLLWPPASVPRPPEADKTGAVVWYVVGEEEAGARKAATQGLRDASHDRACRQQILALSGLLLILVVVVALALYLVIRGG